MFNGQNIKRLSEIRGIKVKTICDTTGISPGSFYTILSERGNPTADNLVQSQTFSSVPLMIFLTGSLMVRSNHVRFLEMVIKSKMGDIT